MNNVEMIEYDEISHTIVYEKIKPDLQIPIKIVKVSVAKDDIKTQVPKHWHRSLEIIIPYMGSTETWLEGKIYNTAPNDFLIINSKEIHSCRNTEPNKDYFGYAIQIKKDFLTTCFKDFDKCYFDADCIEDKEYILKILKEIIHSFYSNDHFKTVRIYSLVYELIYILLKKHSHIKDNTYHIQSEKQKERLTNILTYLDEHCDDITDVQSIAEEFHISYGYLANLFKKYLDTSIVEYLNFVRIKKIEEDLILTDYSILDICLAHGFTNKKSFYREFSKYHSMSPKEYRKRSKKK